MLRLSCLLLSLTLLAGCSWFGRGNAEAVAPVGGADDISVSEDWDCTKTDAENWTCRAPVAEDPAVVAARGAEPAPVQQPEPDPELQKIAAAELALAAALDKTWALQVGAFKDAEAAEQAVADSGMETILIVPTERDGEAWFVLLLGTYERKVDAREAGQAYMGAFPEGKTWVRKSEEIKQTMNSQR